MCSGFSTSRKFQWSHLWLCQSDSMSWSKAAVHVCVLVEGEQGTLVYRQRLHPTCANSRAFPTHSLTISLTAAKAGIMTMAKVCQVTCLRLVERQVPTRKGHFRVGGNVKQSDAWRQTETLSGEAEKSKRPESVDAFVMVMIMQWHFEEAPPLHSLLGCCEAADCRWWLL